MEQQINIEDLTDEQLFIMERFGKLVGEILTIGETALPPGQQYRAFKKMVNTSVYDARNDFLNRTEGTNDIA
jgi:hypothetical protein